jgi:hypothetical protein
MKHWLIAAATLAIVAAGSGSSSAQQPGAGPAGPGGRGGGARMACREDIAKLCAGLEPGGGRIGQCLRQHKDEVSDPCKTALAHARANRDRQSPAPADETPPSPSSGPQSGSSRLN